MKQAQLFRAVAAAVAMVTFALGVAAQTGDPGTQVQEKLVTKIKITKTTADRSDIVTPGDTVVLHKDGLMMCSSDSSYGFSNTYSNGVLAANYKNRAKDAAKSIFRGHLPFGGGGSVSDAANNSCVNRKFVAGEKFWITGVVAQKDGILISTFSDPYPDPSGNQVRYYGEIKFPFPKREVVVPDDLVKTVSEVITVQPPDDKDNGGQGDQGGDAAAPSPAPAPMAPIAPPPPPVDAAPPPSISIGQTVSQVTTAFGQPQKTTRLGTKKIYFYKDMKVTFTNGKVSDVE